MANSPGGIQAMCLAGADLPAAAAARCEPAERVPAIVGDLRSVRRVFRQPWLRHWRQASPSRDDVTAANLRPLARVVKAGLMRDHRLYLSLADVAVSGAGR